MATDTEYIPKDVVFTVGATATEISPETSIQRKVFTITNTSTAGQIITIAFGKDAVAGQGIILYPSGAWSESIDNAYKPTNLRISAVSSAVGGTVTIHERVMRQ